MTTVTDPLGDDTIYTLERDPVSEKVRVAKIDGACPTCGVGPDTDFFYEDSAHPLLPTRAIDAKGTETRFNYGAFGRMESRIDAFMTPQERETTWEYNDPNYETFPTTIVRESVDGAPSERRTEMLYTAQGNVSSRTVTGAESGSAFSHTTSMTYTAEGQVKTIDPPDFGITDVTTFVYDPARGDVIVTERIDPIVGSTFFGYDDFNRRTSTTGVNGLVAETVYDELNRVELVTQRGPTPAEDLVTDQEYTVFRDLFRTVLPRLNVIENGYDQAGRLTSVERKPDASTLKERFYALDDSGNRINEKLQTWNGTGWDTHSETSMVYLSRCFLEKAIRAPGTAEESVTEYAYDCNGNLEKIWDANHDSTGSPTQLYAYDELDRLILVTQPWSGSGGGNAVTAYDYDVQDHLTEVVDAEGNTTTYTYSDRDLLTEQVSVASGTTTFGYNEHGELTSELDATGTTTSRTVDAADRVTLVDYPTNSLDVTNSFGTDPAAFNNGRLISITRDAESIDYEYDSFGRQTKDGALAFGYDDNGNRDTIDYLGGASGGGVTASYTFDHADRHESLSVDAADGSARGLRLLAARRLRRWSRSVAVFCEVRKIVSSPFP